jgi:hypothetical protein
MMPATITASFRTTAFGQFCGIITSYEPNHNAISREPPNSDERYKFDTYTKHILKSGKQPSVTRMKPSAGLSKNQLI